MTGRYAFVAGTVLACFFWTAQAPGQEQGTKLSIDGSLTTPIDPGNDKNIELQMQESQIPVKDSLFPVDRGLRSAVEGMKSQLKMSLGLEFALESTVIYQATSGSRGPNEAAENTTTLSALWTPWKAPDSKDAIGVGFAAETRNNFSGASFVDMTGNIGTLWSPNDATSDDYSTITQVWFGQRMLDGKLVYLLGKIDPGSYINGNRFAGSGNTQFFSQPFATDPAKPFPSNGIGAMGRWVPVDWFHLQAVISDSDAVNTASSFTSINGRWLYATELVFKPKVPGLGEGNYRLMLYRRDITGMDTSGWALSFDQNLSERLGVFFRFDANDGRASAIKQIASGGVAFLRPFGRMDDQAGIGISYAHPSNSGNRDEYSSEVYYRVQVTDYLEFSASAQAVYHPAASREDMIGVFGVRFRTLF